MCDSWSRTADGHGTVGSVPTDLDAFNGDRVPLVPVERVTITSLVDNVFDALAIDTGPAHRPWGGSYPSIAAPMTEEGCVFDGPHAEHGFSALVEIERAAGHVHRLLFDTGVTPDGMVENMRRLDIDPGDIEAVVCSHGHFDHTTGLAGLARRLGRANLPIIIHPDFWSRRRTIIPGQDPIVLPTTSQRALVDAGFEIIERQHPSFLLEHSVLVTGEVPRANDFEHGMPGEEALRNGRWTPDPLILDDQALIVHVRGQGLVVLTGCGHAGIVNIARYARQLTGAEELHAVMGGFHLSGTVFDPIIAPTVEGLADLRPDVVVPAHCTGWKAMVALAQRMPGAFIQNTVGTRYDLVAS